MHIEEIYYYPIKSLRGISLPAATLTTHGIPHDRTFLLLRDHGAGNIFPKTGLRYENMHVSAHPQMCLFHTSLVHTTPSDAPSRPSNDDAKGQCIKIVHEHPDTGTIKELFVPLEPSIKDLEKIKIRMHQSPTIAYRMPSTYSTWLSSIFGFDVVLAYLGDAHRRVLGNISPSAQRNAERMARVEARRHARERNSQTWTAWATSLMSSSTSPRPNDVDGESEDEKPHDLSDFSDASSPPTTPESTDEPTITFADCSPYLVTSSTSLPNVSRRLPASEAAQLDIAKFRPNIVVGGALEEWEEDFWGELCIAGRARISLTANCTRCASLNVDYATGKATGTVLKSLMSDRRVDKAHPWEPIFGRYGFLTGTHGGSAGGEGAEAVQVSVGDEVTVSRRNAERTVFKWPGMAGIPKEEWFIVPEGTK